jgi:hypothetical protein
MNKKDVRNDKPNGRENQLRALDQLSLSSCRCADGVKSNWTTLGVVRELLPGQFQFTDTEAPAWRQRFYSVRAP